MEKLYSIGLCFLAFTLLTLASCASGPQATTTDNSHSPLDRNNGNGLASYMH